MGLDDALECLGDLMRRYARMRGMTVTDVARAMLASKTLAAHGYRHAQKGSLTEDQANAAIRMLHYWIGAKIEHKQG